MTQDSNTEGSFDNSIFRVDCNTFTVFVQTDLQSNDLLITTLKLKVKSVLSLSAQNEDEASFVVEVKNKCRTIALESP